MYDYNKKPCMICGGLFQPKSGRAKFCSTTCKKKHVSVKNRERHKATYVRKGYNQSREANNAWKGGTGVFREIAFKDYNLPKVCNRCGVEAELVHHRDRNRRNNSKENLEILCKACHQAEHVVRDSKGRFKKQHIKV